MTNVKRRTVLRGLASASVALSASPIGSAFGQQASNYPSKPIRLLAGFPPGGPTDLICRLIAEDMSPRLGQPIVVDNRPGASGMLAQDALKSSPADGYTVLVMAMPTMISTILAGKAFNPKDYTPLGFMWDSSFVILANPHSPYLSEVRTLKDLVAVVKANPGKINYSSAGHGSTGHLLGVQLGLRNNMDWTHVSYKGAGPASIDLLAGRVGLLFSHIPNDTQLVQEGKLRAIGASGPYRSTVFPDAPSMAESGFPDLAVTTWGGLIGPAGMPKSIADRLSAELKTTMDKPEILAKVISTGAPRSGSARELTARMAKDYDYFSRAIKDGNIKAE